MEKTKFNWDLKELTKALAKTEEYTGQDIMKIYEHQYGILDSFIKELEKTKDGLRTDILQEFEKRFGHQGYTYINEETQGSLQRVIQIKNNINNNKVKKLLAPDKWNMVKKETVDSDKFFDAVKLGVIPAYTVQEAVTEQEIDKLSWKEIK